LPGFNANQVNTNIKELVGGYDIPEGYKVQFTGEQQEQAESMAFLVRAFLIAIALIMLILVGQFNSVYRPFIVMASVVFSFGGVFFGLALFNMDFIIIMTGIGIVSLAGVVVNNAIVLIDYTDYLLKKRKVEDGLSEDETLDYESTLECVKEAGQTRFRPVILTAITTMLGLAPMAFGLNFNFATLITEFNPQIYFGGQNADFWSPLAWTVIFGLSAATFLTLIIIPSMYLITDSVKRKIAGWMRG
jgi:multidrug efflux pump subunit AcrB